MYDTDLLNCCINQYGVRIYLIDRNLNHMFSVLQLSVNIILHHIIIFIRLTIQNDKRNAPPKNNVYNYTIP